MKLNLGLNAFTPSAILRSFVIIIHPRVFPVFCLLQTTPITQLLVLHLFSANEEAAQ